MSELTKGKWCFYALDIVILEPLDRIDGKETEV